MLSHCHTVKPLIPRGHQQQEVEMKGSIIAIANQKGGVGKTTLAVHLAAWLSRQQKRIILIDGDPQGNATSWLLNGQPAESGLYNVVIARRPLKQCVQMVNGRWNVGLLPGNNETGDAMVILTSLRRPFDTLARAIRPMADVADYVLIDLPPSKAAGFREMLFAADWVLIPTQLERLSLEGVVLMARACKEIIEDQGHGPRLLGIVPNMVRKRTREHRLQLGELVKVFQSTVWPPVAESIRVTETSSRGTVMFDLAPRDPVTKALEIIGRRLLENIGGDDGQT